MECDRIKWFLMLREIAFRVFAVAIILMQSKIQRLVRSLCILLIISYAVLFVQEIEYNIIKGTCTNIRLVRMKGKVIIMYSVVLFIQSHFRCTRENRGRTVFSSSKATVTNLTTISSSIEIESWCSIQGHDCFEWFVPRIQAESQKRRFYSPDKKIRENKDARQCTQGGLLINLINK